MRKFVVTTLLAITTLTSLAAAEGVSVTYQYDGKDYQGYYQPGADSAPLVLLIHDWDGLTDYEVKRSKMLAEQGYAVFAADLFGAGIRPTETKDKRQHTGELYKNRQKMRGLLEAALKTAQAQGGNTANAVAMGYCFGGAAVLELARSGRELRGFATFHGGLQTPEGQDFSATRGKLLVMHGSADSAVPMSVFAALAEDLEAHGIEHEMISYSGAPHAFTVFDSERYREDADRKSWQRYLQFLGEVTDKQ